MEMASGMHAATAMEMGLVTLSKSMFMEQTLASQIRTEMAFLTR